MDEAMRLAGSGFSAGGYCHTCGGALNIRGAFNRAKKAIAPYAHNFYHEAVKPVAEKAFETAKEQARSYLNNKLKKATGGKRPVGRPRKSGGFNWGALGDIVELLVTAGCEGGVNGVEIVLRSDLSAKTSAGSGTIGRAKNNA